MKTIPQSDSPAILPLIMMPLLLVLCIGCSAPRQVARPAFTQLPPDQQLAYAQSQLPLQSSKFRQAMDAFIRFMNDNQAGWRFSLPAQFAVSIAGNEYFSVKSGIDKPNTTLASIGDIVATNTLKDVSVTVTSHGWIELAHVRLGWSSGVTGWWKAMIHGHETLKLFEDEAYPEIDDLVRNLDAAMNSFFATYFGRADGIVSENIRDHMLRNPLFFK